MQEFLSEINYDQLITKHLKGVVADALKIAADQGLPGENHFYITFRTDYPEVEIPTMLRTQYPENMTIVLQHQFSNLIVKNDKFSVDLMFGGIPRTLTIPFNAISYFADPYARFGLSFDTTQNTDDNNDIVENTESSSSTPNNQPAEVISIDSFRRR